MTRRIKKPGAKGAGKGKGNGSDNYEVGYGKPPVHTQFQKGRSGNPKGKPKGRKNTKTMIRDIAFAPIEIQVQGKTQKITAYEATLMKCGRARLVATSGRPRTSCTSPRASTTKRRRRKGPKSRSRLSIGAC